MAFIIINNNESGQYERRVNLPNYVENDPALWIRQVELICEERRVFNSLGRFGLAILKLDKSRSLLCRDLIMGSDELSDPWNELKERLIKIDGKTKRERIKGVFSELKAVKTGNVEKWAIRAKDTLKDCSTDEILREMMLSTLTVKSDGGVDVSKSLIETAKAIDCLKVCD